MRRSNSAFERRYLVEVYADTEPPPSVYPKVAAGTLVPSTKLAMGFPTVPGIPFKDGFENTMLDYAWGPNFIYNDMSGVISREPPVVKQVIPTYVVKTNSDGNEVAGVPSILHQLPLGTYLGWNVTASGFFTGTWSTELADDELLTGATFPIWNGRSGFANFADDLAGLRFVRVHNQQMELL